MARARHRQRRELRERLLACVDSTPDALLPPPLKAHVRALAARPISVNALEQALARCLAARDRGRRFSNVADFRSASPVEEEPKRVRYTLVRVLKEGVFQADPVRFSVSRAWREALKRKPFIVLEANAVIAAYTPSSDDGPGMGALKARIKQQEEELGRVRMMARVHENAGVFARLKDALSRDDTNAHDVLEHTASQIGVLVVEDASVSSAEEEDIGQREVRSPLTVHMPAGGRVRYLLRGGARSLADLVVPPLGGAPGPRAGCMVKAILAVYGPALREFAWRHPRLAKRTGLPTELTAAFILGRPETDDEPMTPTQAAGFLGQRLGVGLRLRNVAGQVVFERAPSEPSKHIRPATLDLVYHGRHVEVADPAAAAGAKTAADQTVVAGNVKQLLEAVTDAVRAGVRALHVVYNGGLEVLLREMLVVGVVPEVTTARGFCVKGLTLSAANLRLTVGTPCPTVGDMSTRVRDMEEHNLMMRHARTLEALLMDPIRCASHPGPVAAWVLGRFGCTILTGLAPGGATVAREERVCMLDWRKFYTSCLRDLPFLPVLTPFADMEAVDVPDDPPRADRLYLVRVGRPRHSFNRKVTLVFGSELLRLAHRGLGCEQLARVDLVCVPAGHVHAAVDALFASPLAEGLKKAVANHAIGKLARRAKEDRRVVLFNDTADANLYDRMNPGGQLFSRADGSVMHCHVDTHKVDDNRCGHFVLIREMVLQVARRRMLELCDDLDRAGLPATAYKTDAVFFRCDGPPAERLPPNVLALLAAPGPLGGLKLEEGVMMPVACGRAKRGAVPKRAHKEKEETSVIIPQPPPQQQSVRRTMFTGLAGRGKTSAALCGRSLDRVLLVAPWNAQAERAGEERGVCGITLHRLLGLGADGRRTKPPFDVSGFDCIVFDEAMLHPLWALVRLWRFVEEHPSITFLATGDGEQLEAIGDVIDNRQRFRILTGPLMFPDVVHLTENRRVRADQREWMGALERDLLGPGGAALEGVLRRHFPASAFLASVDEAVGGRGIRRALTFLNSSASTLNRAIQDATTQGSSPIVELEGGAALREGDAVVCRARTPGAVVNRVYSLHAGPRPGAFVLRRREERLTVSGAELLRCFTLAHCATVHSLQGGSLDEPYVVADLRYATRRWLYTAVSRARDLRHVHFLVQDLAALNKMSVARDMVAGYRMQDLVRPEYDPTDYVTPEWILEAYEACGGTCRGCGAFMTFEKSCPTKVTVNRLNNAAAHVRSNSELLCLRCNCVAH